MVEKFNRRAALGTLTAGVTTPMFGSHCSALIFDGEKSGNIDNSASLNAEIYSIYKAGGGVIFLPSGKYLFKSPVIIRSGVYIVGSGKMGCTLISEVIGQSLIKIPSDGAKFFGISSLGLKGNSKKGVFGNGHAINLIDPKIDLGSHVPQNFFFSDIYIDGFCGYDNENSIDNGKVDACGIIQYDGLAGTYDKIYITRCGHGFYLRKTQNTRIYNSVVTKSDKYACCVYDSENTIIRDCDFINSGDGVSAANYPVKGAISSILWSRQNAGLIVEGCKLKNTSGKALIVSEYGNGDVFANNWLQASSRQNRVHKAMYHFRPSHVKIRDNTFSPVPTQSVKKDATYEQVEIFNDSSTYIVSAILEGNTFEDIAYGSINYNIGVFADGRDRKFRGVIIRGNRFGVNEKKSGRSTVNHDIIIGSCDFKECDVSYNVSVSVPGVLRRSPLTYES